MIFSKSFLHHRKSILVTFKNYRVASSSFHSLRPITNAKYIGVNSSLVPEFCSIISRFESSQTTGEKDVILQLPKETISPQIPVQSNASSSEIGSLPDIPAPDAVADNLPDIVSETVVRLNALGEVPLTDLGLGSAFTPVGWLQRLLEFLHVTFEIPWWSSIAFCVVVARLLIFPFVIKHQRSSVRMHNVLPEMTAIQMKMDTARIYGNHIEMMRSGQELADFMSKNKVSPFQSLALPLIQAPIFISFFIALKTMANAPVESLKNGGMLWFVDLTSTDQYYALPAITCVTLWLTLELGADFSKMPSASVLNRYMPYVMKIIPMVVFPFMIHFPSAVCVYWTTTNFVSLTQVAFLKIPTVRNYFQIDVKSDQVNDVLKSRRKGVLTDVKAAMNNMKIAKEIAERERLDEASFKRAGRLPPAKTFKYNPTLTSRAVQAKKQ